MPPTYGTCVSKDEILSTIPGSDSLEKSNKMPKGHCIQKRYIFSFLAFTACCLAVSYNMNLSIAIVSMVKHADRKSVPILPQNDTNSTGFVKIQNPVKDSVVRLKWDATIMATALGAVYYGQLLSFIPGGRMAELYGGKRMLICCTMVAAFATLLSPVAAMWSPYSFIAARIVVGIGTGPIIPIVFYMLAKWIPVHERSFHASFILSGYGIGSFLAVIISGAISSTTFLGGWPTVYYAGAFFGILWAFICSYLMSESPEVHPSISEKEFLYISKGLGTHKKEKILNIPWLKMACSIPFWTLAIGFFGQFWLLGFFSTVHALYMGTVLNLPVAKTGILACLPHLLRAFATCLASYPIDLILKRKLVSVGFVRKGATIINTVVSCGALLGITYVGRDVSATTILFILAGVLGEFVTFGVCMGCIDIAPNLSGTVSGILNILGVFPFFLIPALVGWLTNYENSIVKWRNVFYFTIAVVSLCTLIFTIFGDLSPQSWGLRPNTRRPTLEESTRLIEESSLPVEENTKQKETLDENLS